MRQTVRGIHMVHDRRDEYKRPVKQIGYVFLDDPTKAVPLPRQRQCKPKVALRLEVNGRLPFLKQDEAAILDLVLDALFALEHLRFPEHSDLFEVFR